MEAPGSAEFLEWAGGSRNDLAGWHSPRYGELVPCFAADVSVHGRRGDFTTVLGRVGHQIGEEIGKRVRAPLEAGEQEVRSMTSALLKAGE
jgi:hypothetical protein